MKKMVFATLMLFSILSIYGHGIDGCSGSFGNFLLNYKGNPSFVGLQHSYVYVHNNSTNFWGQPVKTVTHGHNTSLQLRKALNNRLSINANIPYFYNSNINEGVSSFENGLGDSKVMLEYFVINLKKEQSSSRLSIIGGLELPTGKVNEQIFLRSFSPGSGSIDIPVALQYSYSTKNFSFFTKGLLQINTQNNQKFQFGNQTSFSSLVYKNIERENSFIQVGIGAEALAFGNDQFETTNGTVNYNNKLLATGINAEGLLYAGGWIFKINTMIPVFSNQKKDGTFFFWNTIGINRVIGKK